MRKKPLILLILILIVITSCKEKKQDKQKAVATKSNAELNLSKFIQPVPLHSVLKDPNFYVWGASMVKGEDQ